MYKLLTKIVFPLVAVPVVILATAVAAHAATIGLTGAIGGARVGDDFVVGSIGFYGGGNTNSWPSDENPSFAIDGNNGTRYLNFYGENSGLIVSPTGPNASFAPNALSLVTAVGFLESSRDPHSFTIYGSTAALSNSTPGFTYSLAAMTLIYSGNISLAGDPNSTATVNFANGTAYASYAIFFPTLKSTVADPPIQGGYMQIAEVSLSGDPINSTTVPEPASLLLVGTGVLALIRGRKRGSKTA